MPPVGEKEIKGFIEFKQFISEYLQSKSSRSEDDLVKQFVKDTEEEFLLKFLRGRKCRPKHAWETFKRYANLKIAKYPDMFPEESSQRGSLKTFCTVVHLLKQRDSLGRRLLLMDVSRWNADEFSLLDVGKQIICILEKLLRDEDAMKNGIVVIHDAIAMEFKHCLHYSVGTIRQLIEICWFSFPLMYKSVYMINTPNMLSYVLAVVRVFFPQKLKERMHIWSKSKGYNELFAIVPANHLPISAGGELSDEEAMDWEI